jgi:hypothetical protein
MTLISGPENSLVLPPRIDQPIGGSLTTAAHVAAQATVGRLRPATATAGMMIGRDRRGQPVVLRIVRAEPTRVVIIGGWWMARVLMFRALGYGARIVVRTANLQPWHEMGQAAGRPGAVVEESPARPDDIGATALSPVLRVTDVAAPPLSGPDPDVQRPWTTTVTLLDRWTPADIALVRAAHVTLLQRLGPADVATAEAAWRIGAPAAAQFQAMTDDMLAVVGSGADRFVWLSPTSIEQRFFGPATRR